MPSREYHESLWEQLPEGLPPSHYGERRDFLLARVSPGQTVLDAGCGEAAFTAALAAAGAQAIGIDVAETPLQRARRRDPGLDLRLVAPDAPWSLPDASFDVVWAGELLEHVADTSVLLSEVRRVLRSDGWLLASTPDHGPLLMLALGLRRRAMDEHFDPRGDHLRFYTRRTLSALLEDFDFADVDVRAAGGVPGARALLLASARRTRVSLAGVSHRSA